MAPVTFTFVPSLFTLALELRAGPLEDPSQRCNLSSGLPGGPGLAGWILYRDRAVSLVVDAR